MMVRRRRENEEMKGKGDGDGEMRGELKEDLMVFVWSQGPQALSGPSGNRSSICSGLQEK